jgi:hypothetical protein
MAPIALKIKGSDHTFSPFSHIEDGDFFKTWRVCTKVKDSLEHGTRLENLSWRLWFKHNGQRSIERMDLTTSPPIPPPPPPPQQNDISSEAFILYQYTSDQACDQVVQLKDTWVNSTTDLFDGSSSSSSDYYSMDTTSYNYSTPLIDPLTQNGPPMPTLEDFLDFYIPPSYFSHNNKLLSTLPPETLASAERLLSPHPTIVQQQSILQTPTPPVSSSAPPIKSTPSEGQAPICSNCESTSTPIWRRSSTDNLLCNACGL